MVTFFFVLQMLILLLEDENLSSITERLWNRLYDNYSPMHRLVFCFYRDPFQMKKSSRQVLGIRCQRTLLMPFKVKPKPK
jgi:hypothetical protein